MLRRNPRRWSGELLKHAVLLGLLFFVFFPFYTMVVISLKDNAQMLENPWAPTWPLHWENYAVAFRQVAPYVLNTVVVAVATMFGTLLVASLSAYAFGRYRFPGSGVLFLMVVVLMMIPGVLNLVPSFVLVKELGLLNTYWVLVLPAIAGGQVTAIFILRTFIREIPQEIFESAAIDGASELRMYWHIALPLCRPILATLAILTLLAMWNDYVWPLVTLDKESLFTVTIGLAYLTGAHSTDWGPLMAGYVLCALPIVVLFFFAMRLFVQGLASGAIKA